MTKSYLVETITQSMYGHTRKDVEDVVNTIFNTMSKALAEGHRIEIRGLGSFQIKERRARMGRNPKTGEEVAIPARKVPYFVVGKQLRARVNQDEDE